jgi:rare lipoprotein A (peptidoglycan hydrolase)
VVQVVDDASGATATCVVDDREATNGGRVLDMSVTGFSQLASVTQGVVAVTVSW